MKNPPAYPCYSQDKELRDALIKGRENNSLSLKEIEMLSSYHSGMTLRDYFAGKAMTGILNSLDFNQIKQKDNEGIELEILNWGRIAYMFSDAMLKAREEN